MHGDAQRTSWEARICIAQLTLTKQIILRNHGGPHLRTGNHRAPLVLECAIYATPMRIRSGGHAPRLVGQDIWVITDGKIQEKRETQGYDES